MELRNCRSIISITPWPRDKWLRGIRCNPCREFAMEGVMGADLGFAIIAPQSESSPG